MVEVILNDNKLIVKSDYSEEFIKRAKMLNGKWTGSAWSFDSRNEDRIRNLLLDVYGEDGTDNKVNTVTVQLDLTLNILWSRGVVC